MVDIMRLERQNQHFFNQEREVRKPPMSNFTIFLHLKIDFQYFSVNSNDPKKLNSLN